MVLPSRWWCAALLAAVGLPGATIMQISPNWAELLVRFLTNPVVSPLLLSLGMLGLRAHEVAWSSADTVVVVGFSTAVLALHTALRWRAAEADQIIMPTVAMIIAFGLIVAARLEPALAARLKELALAAYRAVDARGMARVDFLASPEGVYISEMNTIPGFTTTSMFPKQAELAGIRFSELVSRLIELALEDADR